MTRVEAGQEQNEGEKPFHQKPLAETQKWAGATSKKMMRSYFLYIFRLSALLSVILVLSVMITSLIYSIPPVNQFPVYADLFYALAVLLILLASGFNFTYPLISGFTPFIHSRLKMISFNRLYRSSPSGVNLSGTDLRGASLGGDDLSCADLRFANLSRADLSEARLSQANLSSAALIGANLEGADLKGATLIGANLIGANLIGANLIGANLSGAALIGANLIGVDLSGAILSGATLSGAILRNAILSEADLNRAILRRTNMLGASGLTQRQHSDYARRGAIIDEI